MTDIQSTMSSSQQTNGKIFRFKFQPELYESIIEFSHMHRYDDKDTLKESFETWCNEHSEQISFEDKILKQYNYTTENNVKTKIFKSIKYYHIRNLNKKSNDYNESGSDVQDYSKKKKYARNQEKNINISQKFVDNVKRYIMDNWYHDDFKPALYFNNFLEENNEEVEREKSRLQQLTRGMEIDEKTIDFKIKKTFKNQYYTMMKHGFDNRRSEDM